MQPPSVEAILIEEDGGTWGDWELPFTFWMLLAMRT